MLAGEERSPRGRTDRASRIVLGKTHSVGGQLIQGGGLNDRLAVSTNFAVTEIVSEDVDDIGASISGLAAKKRGYKNNDPNTKTMVKKHRVNTTL